MRPTSKSFVRAVCLLLVCFGVAQAQTGGRLVAANSLVAPDLAETSAGSAHYLPPEIFSAGPESLPRMAPELTLARYESRAHQQLTQMASYSAVTRISAELSDLNQHAEFELERRYSAPRSLQFTPLHFSGDDFVKHNVINRLLQQEVEHVEKDEGIRTAVIGENYKFSYKGDSEIGGHSVHVYQVKPRTALAGLFKGRIYLDVFTGALRRTEGVLVKSPSFFIKKIEFTSDYDDFAGFSLPVQVHSVTSTRAVGKAVVNISNRDYSFAPASPLLAQTQP
jgi:hypothetical protein